MGSLTAALSSTPPTTTSMYLYSLYIVILALGSSQAFTVNDLPETPEDGSLWVFLVAGSNGWFNYRHQADVCHAYQIVHAHGVPDDHIIVMMYDDIAFNKENPTPGKVINRPGGPDVYKGVPHDFTCNNVNPEAFLKVLQGEKVAGSSGNTLKSGPADNIFVYFADHGAKGLVAFGEEVLKATDLNNIINKMHKDKKYNKMVFYVEACESGSMFKGLLSDNISVFATTASNATTSSYACYFDEKRKTFLGDVYSIKWLEDSDKEDIEKETLEEQYKIVKKETNTSMVMQFGDMDISKLPVGDFQGPKPLWVPNPPPFPSTCGRDAVAGPDVPIRIQQNIIAAGNSEEEVDEAKYRLDQLMDNRKLMTAAVRQIVETVTQNSQDTNSIFTDNVELTNYDCYYPAMEAFHSQCFNVGKNSYGLRMLNTLVNLCQKNFPLESILTAIQTTCLHLPTMVEIH